MDKFKIIGGKALKGTVPISGAKNSALPAMAAALLTAEPLRVHNIPKVRDLITMSKLLTFMHVNVAIKEFPASDYTLQATKLNDEVAPYELVKTMRASILTLGPLIARVGVARVSLPGGCAIGARPVDLHLTALEKMGAEVVTKNGYIEAKVPNHGRLKGAHIVFDKITVTGTENILMAATLADGETILENAAREPEVTDLVIMLRKMGAQITGDGTSVLKIKRRERASRHRSHRHSRPHRNRHLPGGRRDHQRRSNHHQLRTRASRRHHRQVGGSRRAHRDYRRDYLARKRRKKTSRRSI